MDIRDEIVKAFRFLFEKPISKQEIDQIIIRSIILGKTCTIDELRKHSEEIL